MDGASLDISMIESCFIDIMKGQNVLLLPCQLLTVAAHTWPFVSQPSTLILIRPRDKGLKIIKRLP